MAASSFIHNLSLEDVHVCMSSFLLERINGVLPDLECSCVRDSFQCIYAVKILSGVHQGGGEDIFLRMSLWGPPTEKAV